MLRVLLTSSIHLIKEINLNLVTNQKPNYPLPKTYHHLKETSIQLSGQKIICSHKPLSNFNIVYTRKFENQGLTKEMLNPEKFLVTSIQDQPPLPYNNLQSTLKASKNRNDLKLILIHF